MFDHHLIRWQDTLFGGAAAWLSSRGVSADQVTMGGFVIGVCGSLLLTQAFYGAALAMILLNRLLDGLDGAVARRQGPTERGAFLDIGLDFFFYATVPFGFAVADPAANALAASALLLSFVGTGSSFLAFAMVAAKRGLTSSAYPQKGLYYLGGLTEGAETIIAFAAMCLFPSYFAVISWVFAALAMITTVTRWLWGWRLLSAP
ncbi:phosphatidylglycerophosphate synthase [Rhodoligotrophos appendicifer]|uniref:CDP-alcohol phosphatidyltransferase family protein n=1 Tax=Rhodoligotrophos appendicifer TaxID=987056 RepID=UPI001FE7D689|nr:CDP-alcohol phosphatidyltransferase family protein [Rhodoligotrophos appendicifer]